MRYLFIIALLLGAVGASAQLSLGGKVRTLSPIELKVSDLDGNTLLSQRIESGQEFQTAEVTVPPDLYILNLGEYSEYVVLTNSPVKIKGFINEQNPKQSNLSFDGIDQHMRYVAALDRYHKEGYKTDTLLGSMAHDPALNPAGFAALIWTNRNNIGFEVEPFASALAKIPSDERNALVIKKLAEEKQLRESYQIGGQAYEFTCPDADGNMVSLSDFRGQFVLVDFWASWCGPCRYEMKNLLPIYSELQDDDLEFISISIDDKKENWLEMLEEENLPWVMLWNVEGFPTGDNKLSEVQKYYGFNRIPFIVLIDKQGRIIARNIRGEQVEQAILEARRR